MEFLLLDKNFKSVKIIDSFISAIWTERYSECGDFELKLPASSATLDIFQDGYYLYNPDSEYLMVVESIKTTTDVENGAEQVITGRSIESILDRRIVWSQTIFQYKTIPYAVKALLDNNAISPSDSSRRIPSLIYQSNDELDNSSIRIDAQFTGDNLYSAIKALCDVANYGFKMVLNDNNQLVFSLYAGLDRTRDQNDRTFVEFSPEFDNVINSQYLESSVELRTVTLVAGEGEGSNRKVTTVASDSGAGSGLDRRELYTDARDISSTIDEGTLTDAEYLAELSQRGKEKLAECSITKMFDCETPKNGQFIYGKHFGLGDIVQYRNEYGIETTARVTEYIRAQDASGEEAYPTFVVLD